MQTPPANSPPRKPIRIMFAGSPAIAVPALEAAVALCGRAGGGFAFAGLLTNPDSPRGRSGKLEPTECAAALGRLCPEGPPALKPEKLDAAFRARAESLRPDLLISFAYGKIFGPKFLALFPLGGINIHPSLLPKYRGPTPIPAAIIGRETETGVTIQRLALEMDSGDILAQEKIALAGRETTASLGGAVARVAAAMLPAALRAIAESDAPGGLRGRAQDGAAASYCSLIAKADGLIDWGMGAAEIDARIRAFTPWPLSWTTRGGSQLFILKAEALEGAGAALAQPGMAQPGAALPGMVLGKDKNKGILVQTGSGALAVSELQCQGKKALEWGAFLNGARNFIGERLG